jgi:hypothetical protein
MDYFLALAALSISGWRSVRFANQSYQLLLIIDLAEL